MNCETCRHWNAISKHTDAIGNSVVPGVGTQSGECRCRTPLPATSKNGPWRAFPVTRATDCCGEWSEKAVSEPEPAKKKLTKTS